MHLPIEARRQVISLGGSRIREVANAAMGRSDVLPFWFGELDEATPAFIRQEAVRAIEAGETFYSQNLGRPYLREGIAGYLSALHGRPVGTSRIAAVGSGVLGLLLASELLFEPGDRIVLVTPVWPNVYEIPRILSANVERIALSSSSGRWALDLDKLLAALTPDTKALIVNSPSNPTGWTIDEADIVAILSHCRKHGIWVIADDVYERLIYDEARRSAPSFLRHYEVGDRIISVNSFSKAWTMTGWRAGWLAVPDELTPELEKLIEYNFSCIFEPVQRAAAIALKEGEPHIGAQRNRLKQSRTLLVDALRAIDGVTVPDAGGAMYVFFRVDGCTDSIAFAKDLVDRAGVGLAPGSAFGPEGDGWLRWCHAVDESKLAEGIARFVGYLGRNSGSFNAAQAPSRG